MAVSLDLDDPVTTIVTLLTNGISKTPHTVIAGFTRGGYDWGANKPRIMPIEGKVRDGKWYPRIGYTDILSIPGQHEAYVFKVDENTDRGSQTADHKYADRLCRIQIDIYTAGHLPGGNNPRDKLTSFFREIEAIIFISKTTPGGNWSEVDPITNIELTNRSTGLHRITYDVELKKISEFIGSS